MVSKSDPDHRVFVNVYSVVNCDLVLFCSSLTYMCHAGAIKTDDCCIVLKVSLQKTLVINIRRVFFYWNLSPTDLAVPCADVQ